MGTSGTGPEEEGSEGEEADKDVTMRRKLETAGRPVNRSREHGSADRQEMLPDHSATRCADTLWRPACLAL
ncbi:Hypothetical protein GbCGDNIH2_5042 [Granulibacter bethesdensis]|uniref:Uncharacterized protein n=2 Tax=Granulibacter bethesdensis TaxID=364410 RepID=A0A286M389_GRABC|nr:Hypothetical protein GbCGDNIH3_5042 [Granulibacter bethesdensis]ASV62488.1 Hypothetical protein GbCGDNIH1_5042 [Granulibacter bethesdensis CGDNIH1]AHJ67960.1 Hypothetical protein GbCGDNIH2_5042 [Granulibacter bethesdensis]APH52947.1 Hypothetical protein GbCGDNIH5_5042 [Granulibacter bethesdensis]APH60519.1 Hypothetical protein GbCGDNIH7_5042 [Granulibacter bethesdensis]